MQPTIGSPAFAPRRVVVLSLLAVAALVAGCSDDGGGDAASDASTTTATPTTAAATPARFDGSLEDFYVVPDPLPDGEPGDVVRIMPIDAPAGTTGLRMMYLTSDVNDELRVATGTVYAPEAAAPEDGWPVVAWAHGTSGLAAQCAPSRTPAPPPDYGIEGVQVLPDYLGLGPEGEVHPYLSAAAEGHSMIDAVAAVQSMPELDAGDDWAAVGVSQGGHAVLVTNEMAAERLPGANLVGAAALAPGSELSADYGDQLQIRVIMAMALVGAATEDDDIVLANYLGPDALAASSAITTGCVQDVVDAMVPIAGAPDYFIKDPRTDPVGVAWLQANDPGQVVGAAPLLLVQGGADALVLPARTDALFKRLCGVGQVVERLDVPTADHDTVVEQSRTEVGAWLQDRFAGKPPTDDC